ncbi:MAG TPA: lipoyl(octanoyl) transferase LipB [Solirubrobacterales bacterium]
MSAEVLVIRCGLVSYDEALVAQRWLRDARQEGAIPDALLLLEHPPVYTRGRRATPEELPMATEWYGLQGIEVRDTDRGGRVTYHGPGQLVAYPIVDLQPFGDDVHEYVRRLERVAIGSLAEHGVEARTIEGLTGVWTEGTSPAGGRRAENRSPAPEIGPSTEEARKIGSIGVHVSRGVTTHGLAINVSNDLQPFEWVVPCGIEGCQATSLSRESGAEQDLASFATTVAESFSEVYGRTAVPTSPDALGLDNARLGVA